MVVLYTLRFPPTIASIGAPAHVGCTSAPEPAHPFGYPEGHKHAGAHDSDSKNLSCTYLQVCFYRLSCLLQCIALAATSG